MSQPGFLQENEERGRAPLYAGVTCFAGLAAAFVFVGFPEIDLTVSSWFMNRRGAFVFNYPGAGPDLRLLFKVLFWQAVAVTVVGLLLSAFLRRKLFGLTFPKWLYLALCLVIGPGLVANTMLKDNWGRARPMQVKELGGKMRYTPPLWRARQCRTNCSFVSGEASAIYMVFFAFAYLLRNRRRQLLAAGILAGTAAGFVRIAQGGHFLSDIVFAGVFMALVAQALYWFVFRFGRRALADEGPAHRSLATAWARVAGAGHALAGRAQAAARSMSGPSPRQTQDVTRRWDADDASRGERADNP